MGSDIKQVMHVAPGKSFGAAEADENERRWDESKYRFKNQDPVNHYDKTRSFLNFEIGPDGEVHPLGYQSQSLDERLRERLLELGWKPFKENSKIQPNCCAKFIFAGNHERTLEMAFGSQTVDFEKDGDNSHLQRKEEIELWAKDIHSWCCRRYGKENVIGLQVHLDETSPHAHALIVPVGEKRGKLGVMWSGRFGKNRIEYGNILKEMHTSLYEEVGRKYGLERGDSIQGRDVSHLSKRDYIRKLKKEEEQAEKAAKALKKMIENLKKEMLTHQLEMKEMELSLSNGKIAIEEYESKKENIQKQIDEYQEKLNDKVCKLQEKEAILEDLARQFRSAHNILMPYKTYKLKYDAPQIKGEIPLFGKDKWIEEQNARIKKEFDSTVDKIESFYIKEAEKHIYGIQGQKIIDMAEFRRLGRQVEELFDMNKSQRDTINELSEVITTPEIIPKVLSAFVAIIGGKSYDSYLSPSGGGGGGSSSDLPWSGRRDDEDEEEYRRRWLLRAIKVVKQKNTRERKGMRR